MLSLTELINEASAIWYANINWQACSFLSLSDTLCIHMEKIDDSIHLLLPQDYTTVPSVIVQRDLNYLPSGHPQNIELIHYFDDIMLIKLD